MTLVERARFHLRTAARHRVATSAGEVVVHVFEPEGRPPRASVLVVHGWTSEASFMAAIADFLRRRGFRCVLPDLPAHGESPGRRTSLIDCAHAVREVAEALEARDFVVAHSMGGLAALLAGGGGPPMPRPCPFRAYVLLAVPDRFADVTATFAREQGIDERAQRHFERRLERIACRRVGDFTGTKLLADTGRPALLLHARDDDAVAIADAERIAASCREAELVAFDGLGHRKLLYSPPVVRAAAQFLERQCR